MAAISLQVAKISQRISGSAEDEIIQLWLDAAQEAAESYLNRKVYASVDELALAVLAGEAGVNPIVVTPMVKAAILLIFGKLYANREDVVIGTIATELPQGARSLLQPLRVELGV